MAYTSVIPVRRLDRTVDYVQNKAKTTPKSLEEAVDYAANRDKTESACFETGLGCTTTSAFEDMRLNTLRWHKETGVQGYHLVQSFAEGEVTPELAHQIGVEFAEQLLHGKYQAIVTTHLNTKHYHNHIVWSRPSYAVRQDAYKLDQRIRQMEFLSKNRIDTLAQLETHRKALQTEIGQLQTKRKQLPKTDDVQSQRESVNTALKKLRQEERLCRKIAEHSIEVQQHLTEARRDRAEQQKQEQERARDRRSNIDLTL